MTFSKILGFGLLLGIIMSAVKIFFYQSFNWEEGTTVHYIFWLLAACISVALIRRLGIISFLEAIVVSGVWIFMHVLIDLLITASVVGIRVFIDIPFLIGYFIIIVAMFIFHKKRHVHIRREMKQAGGDHH